MSLYRKNAGWLQHLEPALTSLSSSAFVQPNPLTGLSNRSWATSKIIFDSVVHDWRRFAMVPIERIPFSEKTSQSSQSQILSSRVQMRKPQISISSQNHTQTFLDRLIRVSPVSRRKETSRDFSLNYISLEEVAFSAISRTWSTVNVTIINVYCVVNYITTNFEYSRLGVCVCDVFFLISHCRFQPVLMSDIIPRYEYLTQIEETLE
jgi:hypothetical protein